MKATRSWQDASSSALTQQRVSFKGSRDWESQLHCQRVEGRLADLADRREFCCVPTRAARQQHDIQGDAGAPGTRWHTHAQSDCSPCVESRWPAQLHRKKEASPVEATPANGTYNSPTRCFNIRRASSTTRCGRMKPKSKQFGHNDRRFMRRMLNTRLQ